VHRRRAAADVDDRGLKLSGGPAPYHVGHRRPVAAATDDLLGRGAVIAVVRVQPDPAVGGRVIAGDRVPHRRSFPALRSEEDLAHERRRRCSPIDADAPDGGVVAGGPDPRGGERRGSDRRRREARHVEDRRQDSFLAQDRDRFQVGHAGARIVAQVGVRAATRREPEFGDDVHPVVFHST
jgi:hypothetical protein